MKEKIDRRTKELFDLEMTFNGDSFNGTKDYNKDFNVHATELMCDDDITWDNKIKKLNAELNRRKNEKV